VNDLRRSNHDAQQLDTRECAAQANEQSMQLEPNPASGTAMAASVPDPRVFRNGRRTAAWLGLVPKQFTTRLVERLSGLVERHDMQPGDVIFNMQLDGKDFVKEPMMEALGATIATVAAEVEYSNPRSNME
jgi:hypothetical protein